MEQINSLTPKIGFFQKYGFELLSVDSILFFIMSIACVAILGALISCIFHKGIKSYRKVIYCVSFPIFIDIVIIFFIRNFKEILKGAASQSISNLSYFDLAQQLLIDGTGISLPKYSVFFHLSFTTLISLTFLCHFIAFLILQLKDRKYGTKYIVPFTNFQKIISGILGIGGIILSLLLELEWFYNPDKFELFLYFFLFIFQSITTLVLIWISYKMLPITEIKEKIDNEKGFKNILTSQDDIAKEEVIDKDDIMPSKYKALFYMGYFILFAVSITLVILF